MRSHTSFFTTVAPVRKPQCRLSMLSAFSKMCVVKAYRGGWQMTFTMREVRAGIRSVEESTTGRNPAFLQAASAAGSPFQVKILPFEKSAGVTYGSVEKK